MRTVYLLVPVAFVVAGCLSDDARLGGEAVRTLPPVNATPASTEVAARVDAVGRGILAANPQIGAKSLFRTIGSLQPEIFHRGTSDVFITEGLVRQCQTDGQLAAVLCHELGKMVAEREAVAPTAARQPAVGPPPDVRVGTDSLLGMAPDMTRMRELADYDRARRDQPHRLAPPNAAALSRNYLLRAGFKDADLQAAAPLLQAANANTAFEKQLTAPRAN
ncbi:MAG: M48 family metalloprotease [Gemmataceae bacterium]